MKILVASLALVALTTGCDTSNYAFKVDHSIDIVAPSEQETVSLPVDIAWTDERPPANAHVSLTDSTASYYAVFVDRAPLRPGKSLATLVPAHEQCQSGTGCPSETRLADFRVYLTSQPKLRLEFLRDLRPTSRGGTPDVHEITIVRMRGDRRVGEAAFRQTFVVRR